MSSGVELFFPPSVLFVDVYVRKMGQQASGVSSVLVPHLYCRNTEPADVCHRTQLSMGSGESRLRSTLWHRCSIHWVKGLVQIIVHHWEKSGQAPTAGT